MAWTAPSTWVSGAILTAAQLNTQLRDNMLAIGDAWTSYTPTWTNVTLGTSPTQASAYMNAGKLYIVRISLTLGTGGALTGAPEFTLPNGVSFNSNYSDFARLGWGSAVDASPLTANIIHISPSPSTNARARFYATDVSGTYLSAVNMSATVPWTWTTSDRLLGQFVFEAA